MSKETTRGLIGEHIEISLEMELAGDDEIGGLLEERNKVEKLIKNKADNIDRFVMSLNRRDSLIDAEVETLKDEIQRLRNRKNALNQTKHYLNNVLIPFIVTELGNENGVYETDTARYKLYETFGELVVLDSSRVPDDFIKTEIIQKVDKAKARKACMSLYKDNKEMPDGLEIKRVKRVRRS